MFRCSFLITVLVLILENLVYAVSDNNKVQFILDFLKAQSQPTHPIIWHDCFTIEEKFELVKSSFNPTTFYRQDSLNRRDFGVNSQYYLFILNLACTQSPEGIIQKVTSTVIISKLFIKEEKNSVFFPEQVLMIVFEMEIVTRAVLWNVFMFNAFL